MEMFSVQITDRIQLKWGPGQVSGKASGLELRMPIWLSAITAVIVLSVAVISTWSALQVKPDSLAVLPITFIGEDSDLAYLAVAIQEKLISEIPQSDYLRLVSQASAQKLLAGSQQFRDEELDYFVEGTLRIDGQTARIHLRLVETDTEAMLLTFSDEGGMEQIDAISGQAAEDFGRYLESMLVDG